MIAIRARYCPKERFNLLKNLLVARIIYLVSFFSSSRGILLDDVFKRYIRLELI